jgi:mono/diheme cytochrome c family protein
MNTPSWVKPLIDKHGWAWGAAAGIAATLLVILLISIINAYTGAYNVAATNGHTPYERWLLSTTMRNAVKARAPERAPGDVTLAMLTVGGREYRAMCQQCHGGPGVEREAWAEGLLPRPPHLAEAASRWRREEIFWIVKHGVKMTAMPAFGASHDDETLWAVAAFVEQLPAVSSAAYRAIPGAHAGAAPEDGHADDGHAH